jgi:hypothetical protein
MKMKIRQEIINAVVREIVGPCPDPIYRDADTGEELLLSRVHGSPKSRYGAGMLYPQQTINLEPPPDSGAGIKVEDENEDENNQGDEENRNDSNTEAGSPDEEPVGLANQYLPSAMGFTVRFVKNDSNDEISLNIKSAYYVTGTGQQQVRKVTTDSEIVNVLSKDKQPLLSDYWIRRPIELEAVKLNINSLFQTNNRNYERILKKDVNGNDWLKLQVFNRSSTYDESDGFYTFTFVLINATGTITDGNVNANHILYQNELALSTENENLIAPYREKNALTDTDEEKELNLLYRKKRIFGIGHGTAVNWETCNDSSNTEKIRRIYTSVIPIYEMPQIAPSENVELSMLELSDMGDWQEAKQSLFNLASEYEEWISDIELKSKNLLELEDYRDAAKRNVEKCKTTLRRIKKGIELVDNASEDSDLVKCFRWMNRAMIWQQQRSKTKQRKWIRKESGTSIKYLLEGINGSNNKKFASLQEFHDSSHSNGRWRPFQLAFILMNIESIINPDSLEREIVDLVWFPTGGGKTEAYLGLTAFNIFFRRMKGKENFNWDFYGGTTVLMRYTLRLLTTQQYERAASLICACDLIRKENIVDLGDESISIGLWVGGTSTPNKNAEARTKYNSLNREKSEPYNFTVMKCPSCSSQIGKLDKVSRSEKIKGLKIRDGRNGRVVFQCENSECEYANEELPLIVVDEYIYENPPSLLLGTVDKFAMIPWNKDVGKLFGFRESKGVWTRILPPELIIQDELHLIAGPLGTVVGLYEVMVQTLCNDYRLYEDPFLPNQNSEFIAPKIIASSATISRAREQVKSLYGTDKLHVFPSQGLEFGNTWFSEEKVVDEDYPGRMYLGILASGYPSAQTSIVRAYSTVLQKVKELDNEESINYYWTLLGYFNSIRELGGASSLVYGDIRERLGQIQNRELVSLNARRRLSDWRIEELTGRISSGEIPEVLKKLEEEFNRTNNKALDICLATNMVATGVDISRLGLMFIHGQPKTTAEYIQASSRVGRKLPEGSGLILTLFSPAKPRDKSQYEQFRGYHSRIYSNVEPTSVTPFSINVRERALHAIVIGMVRHFSKDKLRGSAVIHGIEFEELASKVKEILLKRCEIVDHNEVENTRKLIDKRINFWKRGFDYYGDAGNSRILRDGDYVPLMYANSAEVREDIINEQLSLATPTSMRGVDTESVVKIYTTNDYNE